VLLQGLTEALSPYAHTIAAAHETPLPVTDQEVRRAHRPAREGSPAEPVGPQRFTLTVPAKQTKGGEMADMNPAEIFWDDVPYVVLAQAPLCLDVHRAGAVRAVAVHPTGAWVQRADRLSVPALHHVPQRRCGRRQRIGGIGAAPSWLVTDAVLSCTSTCGPA
jgi:hypothetical protein